MILLKNNNKNLKKLFLIFSPNLLWLFLLLGTDIFFSLLLWLADVQAFWILVPVILLASVLLFFSVSLFLYCREQKRIKAFFSFLDNPDGYSQETLKKALPPAYAPILDHLRETLERKDSAYAKALTSLSDYEEYVESWAHEIKVPLSLLTLLLDNHRDEFPKTVCRKLDHVRSRTLEYINQMLFYARLKGTRKDYLFESIPVRSAIENVLEDYLPLLEEKHFQIHIDISGQQVYTDRRGLSFLLGQLISNSLKYSKNSPEIHFDFVSSEQSDTLFIRDNGTGVPSCDLPYIFEKGFTGDSGDCRKKATGMGLYLANEIAKDLNITLNACSEYGKNFEMQIEFPVVR